ncbi:hypothetical protein Tco_0850307 [Tanacetum coccineum]
MYCVAPTKMRAAMTNNQGNSTDFFEDQLKIPVTTTGGSDSATSGSRNVILVIAPVSSNGKPLIEVSLEEEQSKGTTKKPRKRKPKTQAKSSTESNEAVQIVKNRTTKPLYPLSGKSVVMVESVTKANVIPSYGHVRDLAARLGWVRPDEEFSMVWEVPSAA